MRHMARQAAALLASVLVAACAANAGEKPPVRAVDEIDLQRGFALKGYDPVAYFAEVVRRRETPRFVINGAAQPGCFPRRSTERRSWEIRRATRRNSEDIARLPYHAARRPTAIRSNGPSSMTSYM